MPRQHSNPVFGLLAYLEKTRIVLPLQSIDAAFQILGDVADVQLDQNFRHTGTKPLHVTYTFPLPAEAAVYCCEMEVNGRLVRAKVEEKEKARKIIERKKAAGFRTSLVEVERDNLFTLELGNVQPGDAIRIRFAYLDMLDRAEERLRLRIPLCPGIRYIPGNPLPRRNLGTGSADDTDQVPDASRISPPRISGDHPDAATIYLHGTFRKDETALESITSPSHPICVRPGETEIAITLAVADQVPDCDLVLHWWETKPADLRTAAWSTLHDGKQFALIQFRAPEQGATTGHIPTDVYFLIDRSGSMEGEKWSASVLALKTFVSELHPSDRAWIAFFNTHYKEFTPHPQSPVELLSNRKFLTIEQLGTDGGTEVLPALKQTISKLKKDSKERAATIVLITDGQVGNEDAVTSESVRAGVPVHCFGIDTAVNDAFLKSISRATRGTCVLMTPEDDITGAVMRLGKHLANPVLPDIRLPEEWENAQSIASPLYAGEIATIVARGPAEAREIRFTAPDHASMTLKLEPREDAAPRLLWAKRRCESLIAAGEEKRAIEIAKEHNILCRGAAFMAWDESEKVAIARQVLVQPAMEQHVLYDCLASICDSDDTMGFAEMASPKQSAPAGLSMRRRSMPPPSPAPTQCGAPPPAPKAGRGFWNFAPEPESTTADHWREVKLAPELFIRLEGLEKRLFSLPLFKTTAAQLLVGVILHHVATHLQVVEEFERLVNALTSPGKESPEALRELEKFIQAHLGEPARGMAMLYLPVVERTMVLRPETT